MAIPREYCKPECGDATKPLAVRSELAEMSNELQELREVCSKLESRLVCVMREQGPECSAERLNGSTKGTCEIAAEIAERTEVVRDVRNRLAEVIRRLEV